MQNVRCAAVRIGILVCGVLLPVCAFGSNFPEDFQAAKKLSSSGKPAEAEEAFLALAGRNLSKRATDESLAQAASCAAMQKKYDKALEYAGRISDPAMNKACQVQVFRYQNRWDDILALSKGEDIESWPDALIYDTLLWRGRAFAARRDGANAEKDFLAAVRHTVLPDNKAVAYVSLGEVCHEVAKDDEKALQAYGEVMRLADPAPAYRAAAAVMARARILTAQGKGVEALAELDRMPTSRINDAYWLCSIQACYGEVLEGLGRNADALARYKAAAAYENVPQPLLDNVKKKMDALQKIP